MQLTVLSEVGDVVVEFFAGGAGGRDVRRGEDAPYDSHCFRSGRGLSTG